MTRRRAALAIVTALTTATVPHAYAAGAVEAAACRGVAVERFERGLPAETRRYAVGAHLAAPFVQIWSRTPQAKAPAAAQAAPEAVAVYATGRRPFLVAYRTGGCVVAVVAVERSRLWQVLRQELGQPA